MKILKVITLFFLLILLLPSSSFALDPQDYIPAPAGTNGVLFYYDHISGTDAYVNGNKVSNSADMTANIAVFRYAYWNQIGQFPWAFSALVPVGELSMNNVGPTNQQISTSQIGDPFFLIGIWPISKPDTKTWLGISQYVYVPAGEYDHDKPPALQLGQNRWAFKEEIGFVQGFGPFELDLSGFVQFFTNNGNYTPSDLTLKKDNLYEVETHFIWNVNKNIFLSADYSYQNGGETSVSGVSNNDKLNDHSAGVTVAYHLTTNSQVMFKYHDTFKTENGIKTKDLGFRFAVFF